MDYEPYVTGTNPAMKKEIRIIVASLKRILAQLEDLKEEVEKL